MSSVPSTSAVAGAWPASAADTDRFARRLAYLTVGVPTLGFACAVGYWWRYGVSMVDLCLLIGMYLITSLGVEGGFHRFFSHKSFSAKPAMTAFWGVAGSMAAQGPILFWVAIHRQHHAFTDRDGDPHSPRPLGEGSAARLRGLWHGHVGWLFTVRRGNWSKLVPDLLRDRLVMKINQLYFVWVLLGLALPALLGWAVTGTGHGAVGGFLWGGLARIFLLDHVTWGVNSIGHTLGNRPHQTRDNSRNVAALAPFSVGGSWHNNHHAQPALAHNRHAFWQFDLAGAVIRLLDTLGLVSGVRYPDRGAKTQRPATTRSTNK